MNDRIDSWEDLDKEIESLFNTPDSLTTKIHKDAYHPLKEIVAELKNNQEKYQAAPEEFSGFIFKNPEYVKNFYGWLPYLSGARAKLVEMKFFDGNKNEITDPQIVRQIVESNDPEVTSNTYLVVYPDFKRVEELNMASIEQSNVYADINPPKLNLKAIKKIKK